MRSRIGQKMDETRAYYEKYWNDPAAAPPSSDPTTDVRKAILKGAVSQLSPKGKALDVGCGGAEFTAFLQELGFKAMGIDLSEKAIAFGKRQYPAMDLRVGTPTDLLAEFKGAFQVAWSTEVIEHVFDVYGFLTAVQALLEPKGKLILTTPFHGRVKNILIGLSGYAEHYKPFGGHIRFFDKRSMDATLRHCGFTPTRWTGFGRIWPVYKSFFVVAEKTHDPLPPPPADA
jgi:2-polyprenyl-3-methyl-5-hydroxy-6-metoxy-1,4-benzoquinol methylase